MNPDFHYERGHPAGWTDDLGIIADTNRWVMEHHAGWYNNMEFDLYKKHGLAGLREEVAKLGIELRWVDGSYYAILEEDLYVWLRLKYQ